MAAPVVAFQYQSVGLSVNFIDGSSGNPTSWSWDFGDNITSNSQNPSHTYLAAGEYRIVFTATNIDGSSSMSFDLIVATTPTLGSTIKEMVEFDLPGVTAVEEAGFISAVRQWQLFFQKAAQIADADVFDETKWPSLWNVLIAKQVDFDLIIRGIPKILSGSSTTGSGGSTGGLGKGAVKSMEMGPSKASWYDPSTYWTSLFKSTVGGSDSIIESVRSVACALGSKLGVKVPNCPKNIISPPLIVGKCQPVNTVGSWFSARGLISFAYGPSCK
jgi:PKD repeat protein